MTTYQLFRQCYCSFRHPKSSRALFRITNNLVISSFLYTTQTARDTFMGKNDTYKGIIVDLNKEPCKPETFSTKLNDSLSKWNSEGRRCIWFKVNIKDAAHVPVLAQKGFNFHHARDDFVMMYKWLPKDITPNLPPASHTNLGVGVMVFNKDDKLLAISEKAYDYPHWKLPGGYVEKGEDLIDAAIREVQEETGILTAFESLVTFRHRHNSSFGNSDIYVLLRMKALTEKITVCAREIAEAKWMDVEEYTNNPHVHAFNKLLVKKALEYRDARKIKLNFEKKTVQWAKYVSDMNYLVIEDMT